MDSVNQNKMKTAIDWLIEQTRTDEWHSLKRCDIIEIAKEKEKAQIVEAFNEGYRNGEIDFPSNTSDKDVSAFDNAENYYTETFTQIEPNF